MNLGKLKDFLFESEEKKNDGLQYYQILNNSLPIFSQFGHDVYASDVVQQAVYAIVKEMKKLNPRHVIESNRDVIPVEDDTHFLLQFPNSLQTFEEFQERYYWCLLLNYNVFVYKQFRKDEKGVPRIKELYVLNPYRVDFIEDSKGKMFLEMYFRNGDKFTIPRTHIIHQKIHAAFNELMGGNESGQPDNKGLLKTLNIYESLLEGVRKSMNAAMAVNGIVKYNTMVKNETVEANIKKLEEQLARNESGFMGLDIKNEFIPIKRELKAVDEDTLKFIDDQILRHFSVPLSVVRGEQTKETMEAFYQSTLEHLVKSQSSEFTKELFSRNQILVGNKIKFYYQELNFMTNEQKIAFIQQAAPQGAIYQNELRTMFGMIPLPELTGKRMMSLNWIDATKANEYQLKGGAKENEK